MPDTPAAPESPVDTSRPNNGYLTQKQKASVWSNQFYQGIQITLPYTLSVFVVRHFSKGDERTVGQLTGILAGSFSAAQFVTSYFWGVLSDRCGRKPVILVSNVVTALAGISFGLAGSLELALTARIIGGLFNGSGVAIKTMLAEACKPTEQARGMAMLSLGWGMGSTLGPMLGGSLASPCDRYPGSFLCREGSIFAARPFLLPCMVIVLVGIFSTYTNFWWLEETNPRILRREGRGKPRSCLGVLGALGSRGSTPTAAWAAVKHQASNLSALLGRASRYSRLSSDEVELGRRSSGIAAHRAADDRAHNGPMPRAAGDRSNGSLPKAIKGPGEPYDPSPFESLQLPAATNGQWTPRSPRSEGCEVISEDLAPGRGERGLRQNGHASENGEQGMEMQASRGTPHRSPMTPFPVDEFPLHRHLSEAVSEAATEMSRSEQLSGEGKDASRRTSCAGSRHTGPTKHEEAAVGDAEGETAGLLQGNAQLLDPAKAQEPEPAWWKNSRLMTAIAGYGSVVFLFNFMDELVPLFASAPRTSHGLGLTAPQLAWPLSCAGATLVCFALLVYPPLQRRVGPHKACRLGLACAAPCVLLVPTTSLLPLRVPWTGAPLLGSLGLSLALRSSAGVVAMTASMIMINLSAPAGQIGAVNGAGNTLAAFNRALGPFMCGQIWGILVAGSQWTYMQFAPFAVVSGLMVATCVLYSCVRLQFD